MKINAVCYLFLTLPNTLNRSGTADRKETIRSGRGFGPTPNAYRTRYGRAVLSGATQLREAPLHVAIFGEAYYVFICTQICFHKTVIFRAAAAFDIVQLQLLRS